MTIELITTHSDDAVARFLFQYKNKEKIEGHIRAYIDQIQDLENAYFSLRTRLSISQSEGVQLDGIGKIVGEPRGENDDPRYRVLLFARIGTNVSEGLPENIINVFKLLTEADWVQYQNLNDAQIMLTGTATFADQDEVNFIFDSIQKAVSGGVRVNHIICSDTDEAFAFAGINANAPGLGFGDEAQTTGGKFAQDYEKKVPFAFAGNDPLPGGFGGSTVDPLVGGVLVDE